MVLYFLYFRQRYVQKSFNNNTILCVKNISNLLKENSARVCNVDGLVYILSKEIVSLNKRCTDNTKIYFEIKSEQKELQGAVEKVVITFNDKAKADQEFANKVLQYIEDDSFVTEKKEKKLLN